MNLTRAIIAYGCLSVLHAHSQTAPRITQILPNPGIVGGVSVADMDMDGDQDILVSPYNYNFREPVHFMVMENTGNRTFSPPRTGFLPFNVRIEDAPILGDFTSSPGKEWFICLWKPKNERSIYRAYAVDPDADTPLIPLGPESEFLMHAIDLDGDGTWELLQEHPSGNGINILNRQPDGSYGPVSGTASYPEAMAPSKPYRMIDCDADGALDMVWSSGRDTLLIFKRTGSRSFAAPIEIRTLSSLAAEMNDLNGDGLPDLHDKREPPSIYSEGDPNTFSWRINLGGLSWGPRQSINLLTDNKAVLARVIPAQGSNATLIYTQTGETESTVSKLQFAPQEILSTRTIPAFLPNPKAKNKAINTLADFDGDGREDALCETFQEVAENTRFTRLSISWGTASGFAAPVPIHAAAQTAGHVLMGDWDQDNDQDVIIGPDADGTPHMLLNDGAANFSQSRPLTELAPPAGSPVGTTIHQMESADVNRDGLTDLVISYQAELGFLTSSVVVVARAKADGSFYPPVLPAGAFDFFKPDLQPFTQFIDFDGDGDVDLIGMNEWRENISGKFAQESHPLIAGDLFSSGAGIPMASAVPHAGDLDGDGAPEFINGTYTYQSSENFQVPGRYISMAVGFNDGRGGLISMYEIPATLSAADFNGNLTILGLVRIADLNGDNLADLCTFEIVGISRVGIPISAWFWRRNPGGGSRTPHNWLKLRLSSETWSYNPSEHPFPNTPVPTLDFDGDGRLEWVSPSGYLRPSPAGPVISTGYDFDSDIEITRSGIYQGAADFDSDGDADFLIESSVRGALFLMRNLTVDERCPITIALIDQGVLGGFAGPDADADHDGRSNFFELLEGTNPTLSDAANLQRFLVRLTASGASFDRRTDASKFGMKYQLESSIDLRHWAPVPETNAAIQSLAAPWQRLTLPAAGKATRVFYRLTVKTAGK